MISKSKWMHGSLRSLFHTYRYGAVHIVCIYVFMGLLLQLQFLSFLPLSPCLPSLPPTIQSHVFDSNFRSTKGFIVTPRKVQGKLTVEDSQAASHFLCYVFFFLPLVSLCTLSLAPPLLIFEPQYKHGVFSRGEMTNGGKKPSSRGAGLYRALAEDLVLKLAWLLLLH